IQGEAALLGEGLQFLLGLAALAVASCPDGLLDADIQIEKVLQAHLLDIRAGHCRRPLVLTWHDIVGGGYFCDPVAVIPTSRKACFDAKVEMIGYFISAPDSLRNMFCVKNRNLPW